MNKLVINTAQNVNFEYNLATLGSRIIAFFIDFAFICAYLTLIVIFVSNTRLLNNPDVWLLTATYLVFALPIFFYALILETVLQGQTLGKKIMHLKVVKVDGTRATTYQYFIRWVCSLVDIFLCMGALGVSSIMLSKLGQRIGDMAADTTVINTKHNTALQETLFAELTQSHTITFPQVIAISDTDMNTIKEVFKKGYERKDYNIILALSNKLVNLLQVKPEMRPEEFIDIVIKDHYFLFRDR